MSYKDRFWKKSWDDGIKDLDPKEWKDFSSLPNALSSSFENNSKKAAIAFNGIEISYSALDKYSNQFSNMLNPGK